MANEEISWDVAEPGAWQRDTTHMPGAQTNYFQQVWPPAISAGFAWMSEAYGMAICGMRHAYLHDHGFGQPAFIEPEAAPAAEAAAVRAREDKRWRADADRWYSTERPAQAAANRALHDEDPATLSDADLVDHLDRATRHLGDSIELHFRLHGPDTLPIGHLVLAAQGWGITAGEVLTLLTSPATAATLGPLARLGELVAESSTPPATLDDIRALGTEASELVDAYLAEFGLRVTCAYDVASPTLAELPEATVASIRSMAVGGLPNTDLEARTKTIRERVPEEARAEFDELLDDAAYVYGMRDDNVGLTFLWPLGIARRALLEVGRRAVERGLLTDREQALDTRPDEVSSLVAGDAETAKVVVARAQARARHAQLDAPESTGTPDPAAMAVLAHLGPEGMRNGMAMMTAMGLWYRDHSQPDLHGLGIGDTVVRGRARVAHDPATALASIEPGDILVAPFTTPAYNAVLPACSALVTAEGGALSHAALLARELGLPAVVGANAVMEAIADGAEIEVDATTGEVRICP